MAAMEELLLHFTNTTTLISTFLILFILYLVSSSSSPQRKEPPGPRPVPLLGNLLLLDPKSPHTALYELSKKYGPVYTMHFGPKKTVVLAGHKTIRQALVQNDAFADREALPIISDLKLTHGIVFSNGDTWKEMRQFALSSLKQFGMGKRSNEEKIIEEAQNLIEVFQRNQGRAFDTSQPVSYAVSNIICSLIYGQRYEYDDQQFRSMVDQAITNTQLMGSPSVQLYNSFPRLFSWVGARNKLLEGASANRKRVAEIIKSLQETLNPHMCRGFVDSFLTHKIKLEESGKMNSQYHDDNLQISVVNMFSAGSDSTSSTLRYSLLIMAKYPEIQDRVQMELARVIGSRQPRVEDRKDLPYIDAVIHETQRIANAVPLTVRSASRDVTFQGHFIRKDTPVVILLSSALQEEAEWEKTYSFNPDHFLDEDGNFKKREAFLPFSAGSRNCLGESLARMEIFLFFTSLLQHFRFTPPPGVTQDELDLTPVVGFTLTPAMHKLCAISRHL
ncbi:cytochrome P450 2K1-like [Limanda limanda]|uniref:cytochrome P450 2K1-like n=1 Tax=Limanda limanda TaxID=27771 RepID=UPI0029C88483|nr:cytochrome P450 2K1-like [Limanda limanda]